MTFDKSVFVDFLSGLSLRLWTDSEFWQNLGLFADNKISQNEKGRRPEVKILTLGQVLCEIGASSERGSNNQWFDPIWPHINVKYFCPHGLWRQCDTIFEWGWPYLRLERLYWPQLASKSWKIEVAYVGIFGGQMGFRHDFVKKS